MSKSPPKEPVAAKPERNIIWVGVQPPPIVQDDIAAARTAEDAHPWVAPEPPSAVYLPDFPEGIELPDAKTQRAGFFLKQAGRVIQDVPGFREFREDKGKKE